VDLPKPEKGTITPKGFPIGEDTPDIHPYKLEIHQKRAPIIINRASQVRRELGHVHVFEEVIQGFDRPQV
jgi:hypothetical protein